MQSLMEAALWILIIALQAVMAASKGRNLGFLKSFLGGEAVLGAVLFTLSRVLSPGGDPYFYSWCIATLIHYALCAFLLANIFDIVRKRGLPSRQSPLPLYALAAGSLLISFRFAGIAVGMLKDPALKLVMPLDHALSFCLFLLVSLLPLYSVAISSSIPKQLYLVIAGFALYEATYSGSVGIWMTSPTSAAFHVSDIAYLVSLLLWFVSLNSGHSLLVKTPYPSNNEERN